MIVEQVSPIPRMDDFKKLPLVLAGFALAWIVALLWLAL